MRSTFLFPRLKIQSDSVDTWVCNSPSFKPSWSPSSRSRFSGSPFSPSERFSAESLKPNDHSSDRIQSMNITEATSARSDRYAKRQGPFVLGNESHRIDDPRAVWDWMVSLGGRQFRVLYRCENGIVRDLIGRQGVHDSEQDGAVQGTGVPMRSAKRLTLSFWTNVFGGKKVNTGAGKGYRTLRADRILAVRCGKVDVITTELIRELRRDR